jgi:hypothetical protein
MIDRRGHMIDRIGWAVFTASLCAMLAMVVYGLLL